MRVAAQAPAVVDTGRGFFTGSSGKWAGEQFLAAIMRGEKISPEQLRTNTVLMKDDWKYFDTVLVEEAFGRLRAVADLIAAGLTLTIPNGLAKTVLEYQKVGDMNEAIVSLDGVTRSENDRLEFELAGLPLPITHKDWYLNLRHLLASREGGTPLDTTYVRVAGRKIAEATEDMLFNGSKTFGGLTIYGYLNYPQRNTESFGTNGAWHQSAKTGDNIVVDVHTMLTAMEANKMFGPYWLYVPLDANFKLGEDYKAQSDKTIRQRILEIEGIAQIRTADRLPSGNVVMVQPTSDVVQLVSGEPLQTVQWDIHGGFQINFKAFQIMVPLIKSDTADNCGIVHMS